MNKTEENPYEDFKTDKRELGEFAKCKGMGHYLCNECKWKSNQEESNG